MFDRLVSFTKNLFTDENEQQQQQQQRASQQREQEQRLGRSNVSMNSSSTFTSDNLINFTTPLNLWEREDLSYVLTDNKIQNCYDEKFRRGLVKYGAGVNYKQPNLEIIRAFMVDIRDLYIILISQKKNQQNMQEELSRLSEEFNRDYFPFLTKHRNSSTMQIKVVEDMFSKLLPKSFKSRDDEKLNELIYKLFTYDKLIIIKMTESRLQDSDSFRKTSGRMDALKLDAESYLNRVVSLRGSILKMKSSAKVMKDKIQSKFTRKMKAQKVLYILEKIKKKYDKVLGYVSKDLSEASLYSFKDLYEIFMISLINFKSDVQKFPNLKVLKKFEEAVTKKLISLKKRMKNEMYLELKSIVGNQRVKRTERLTTLIDQHNSFSQISEKLLNQCRVDGKLPKGLEFFDDRGLLESHYNDIINYNPSLDSERTKGLLFNSVPCSGGNDGLTGSRIQKSTMGSGMFN